MQQKQICNDYLKGQLKRMTQSKTAEIEELSRNSKTRSEQQEESCN